MKTTLEVISKTRKSILVKTPKYIRDCGEVAQDDCRVNFRWLANSGLTLEQAVMQSTEKTMMNFKAWVK